MLWLQIATKLGIALLTFVTHPQTYGNPYLPLTIGAFIEAAVPNILFIVCPHSTSIPSLPAPPTRQAISGSPATAPSTDLILWTPIGLPVSAGLHLPTLMATPISSPSGEADQLMHSGRRTLSRAPSWPLSSHVMSTSWRRSVLLGRCRFECRCRYTPAVRRRARVELRGCLGRLLKPGAGFRDRD